VAAGGRKSISGQPFHMVTGVDSNQTVHTEEGKNKGVNKK
jgi:hypothetical protein